METMTNETISASNIASPGSYPPDAEYRVVDLGKPLRVLWRGRYRVAGMAVLGGLLAVAAAFIVHPRYEATVRLMPPDHKESLIASLSPGRNEGDLYLGLLQSRTVADDVIEHQHLVDYFHSVRPSQARAMLSDMAKISVDKEQFLSVVVTAREPETALRVANEFPAALYRVNHSIALSQAAHRREYFEVPLEQERDALNAAEQRLLATQQNTGMVMPEAQVQLGLSSIAQLQQQITSRRAQLASLETSSTAQNPQVIQLQSEIASLSGQLGRLQAQTGSAGTSGPARAPAQTLEVARSQRDVKYHETVLQALSKQYENARIEDSYSPPIELVDKAVMPDQKSWPSRKLWFLLGIALGGIIGVIAVLARAYSPLRRVRNFLREDKAAPVSPGA